MIQPRADPVLNLQNHIRRLRTIESLESGFGNVAQFVNVVHADHAGFAFDRMKNPPDLCGTLLDIRARFQRHRRLLKFGQKCVRRIGVFPPQFVNYIFNVHRRRIGQRLAAYKSIKLFLTHGIYSLTISHKLICCSIRFRTTLFAILDSEPRSHEETFYVRHEGILVRCDFAPPRSLLAYYRRRDGYLE